MIGKLLIANRGEIALRILRACKELGIRSVVVYSEADRYSLPVRFADEVVCIGPGVAEQSYLNVARIISAAEITGADAIHPGYGFLAEDAKFAEVCHECGINFVGPPVQALQLMGDKAEARRRMAEVGVPVVPGSEGPVDSVHTACTIAAEIGYPVMVKAVAGGGGKGMRIAEDERQLREVFPLAQGEAEKAFGNASLYVEKYIEEPRHIEVQILADTLGNLIHLGERDCTIQRRHQKLVEETPSPVVSDQLRSQLGEAALQAARGIDYVSAGTLEFLLDRDGSFYFMEMNTRIQVEHPVTEEVTRTDIIKEQIKVAAGERLSCSQDQVSFSGHAIECRINAEDPERDFLPSVGKVEALHFPGGPGIRVDSHIFTECEIPPYYDSLLAKLIVWGGGREEARQRMARALEEFVIEGIKTTIPFHREIINHPAFIQGQFGTNFIQKYLRELQTI